MGLSPERQADYNGHLLGHFGVPVDRQYSIAQAKDRLSELVQAAERGEMVTVTRRGKPVVRVVSESEFRKLVSRRRKTRWSTPLINTSGFRFNREEADRR